MKLETKRLILREWKKTDTNGLINILNNLKVSKWLLVVPCPYTRKDANLWINRNKNMQRQKKRKDFSLVIELKENKKVIGGISITPKGGQEKASVGYWLGENYWKQKYGSEALDAILKFAFNKLKLKRIEAGVFVGNPSSGKLLEKFGFKREGLKRKSFICKADKKIKDEIIYGLLKEEWRKLK